MESGVFTKSKLQNPLAIGKMALDYLKRQIVSTTGSHKALSPLFPTGGEAWHYDWELGTRRLV